MHSEKKKTFEEKTARRSTCGDFVMQMQIVFRIFIFMFAVVNTGGSAYLAPPRPISSLFDVLAFHVNLIVSVFLVFRFFAGFCSQSGTYEHRLRQVMRYDDRLQRSATSGRRWKLPVANSTLDRWLVCVNVTHTGLYTERTHC